MRLNLWISPILLQGWPGEQEVAVEAKVEAQLEQATQQLKLRIEKLRAKEEDQRIKNAGQKACVYVV